VASQATVHQLLLDAHCATIARQEGHHTVAGR
jgi:hypothetical protein